MKKLNFNLAWILLIFLLNNKIYSFAPGDLDPTFGTGGIVTTTVGPGTQVSTVIQLSNSKVIAVGTTAVGGFDASVVARYNFNGSLDTTFGSGGITITTIPGDSITVAAGAMQSSGKILSMGASNAGTLIIRYNANGSLDTSFGTNGIVTVPIIPIHNTICMSVQQDDKILVGGEEFPGTTGFFIFRLNSDGTTDTTFGAGTGMVSYLPSAQANRIAFQSNGKIIVVGNEFTTLGIFVARLNIDGTLDATFGGTGIVIINIGVVDDLGISLIIQPNGKIVVVGSTDTVSDEFPIVLRLNTDGTLDNSFGTAGILTITQFNGGPLDGQFLSVGLQTDGKIVAVGTGTTDGFTTVDFLVARINTDGTLDNTYGIGGLVLTNLGGSISTTARSVVINQSNNLATVGGCSPCLSTALTLARYLPTSELPPQPPQTLTFSMDQAGSLFVPSPGLLVGQPSGSIVILLTPPTNGILSISSDGSFTYVPNADFSGTDSFTYTISTNGVISSSIFSVDIDVAADTTLATSGIGAELVHAIRKKYGTRT